MCLVAKLISCRFKKGSHRGHRIEFCFGVVVGVRGSLVATAFGVVCASSRLVNAPHWFVARPFTPVIRFVVSIHLGSIPNRLVEFPLGRLGLGIGRIVGPFV